MKGTATPILVTKSTGELEPFDMDRLRDSLERSGASKEMSAVIARSVEPRIGQGMSTRKIYRLAFKLLSQRSKHLAARYSLKQAIMDLGPSGFPFERFIARLLEKQGYRTQVGAIVEGRCVSHEIDVVAERNGEHFLVECKYHSSHGSFCDVKVPLYIQSRFRDIDEKWKVERSQPRHFGKGWLITNTRFTTDAMKYGLCAGLKMLGWDQPDNKGLKELIDDSALYPLTCMITLSKAEKARLLDQDLVLASEILQNVHALTAAMVKPERVTAVLAEAEELSGDRALR